MTRKFGSGWETDPAKNLSNEKISELQLKARESIESTQQRPRLIDFCEILDLRNIIEKNWDLFSPIFSSKDILHEIEKLNSYRIPTAHGRDLKKYQKFACIGLCGEIRSKIHSWNEGFNIPIKEYVCELYFASNQVKQESRLDQQTQNDLRQSSQQPFEEWLTNISQLGTLEQSPTEWVLRAMGNHLKITSNRPTRYSTGSEQWMTTWARIVTGNKNLLDKVLEIGNKPYGVLHWILNSEFDVDNIVRKVRDLTGISPGSFSATASAAGSIVDSASYGVANLDNSSIRILIATQETLCKVSIQRDGGPNVGFTKAHLEMIPDDVLSRLYGEMPQVKFLELIKKSCN